MHGSEKLLCWQCQKNSFLPLDQGARLGIAMPPSERFFRMALANLPRDSSGVVLPTWF
jgi:hypothetical protein